MKKDLIEAAVEAACKAIGNGFKSAMQRAALVPWATYNYKGGIIGGTATGPSYTSQGGLAVVEVNLDFAAIAAARVAASQAAIAATDVLQVVGVYAGIYVPLAAVQCSTVEGAAATVDVGDGNGANGFLDDFNLNALGRTASLVTTAYSVAVGGGVFYNVDDTVDWLINSNNVDVAEAAFFVTMMDLRKTRGN